MGAHLESSCPFRTNAKSPLHPSALRLNDLTPGRRILRFNRAYGSRGIYTVVGRPFVGYLGSGNGTSPSYEGQPRDIIVILRGRYGTTVDSLADMGVIPYDTYGGISQWNDVNFTIDARKAHLLPQPDAYLKAQRDRMFDDLLSINYEEEEEWLFRW